MNDAERIVEAVVGYTGYSRAELTGERRYYELRRARLLLWACLRLAGLSYPAIGRVVNRRHMTILQGLQKASNPTAPAVRRVDWAEARAVNGRIGL